jgi:phage major head subunit gpT-like protein
MLITPASLKALQVTLDLRFKQAYAAAQPISPRIASTIQSGARANVYPLHAKVAKLRPWNGERKINNAKAYKYQLDNESFELTIEVDRDDMEDDSIGVYSGLVDEMGMSARMWPDDLVFSTILEGENVNAYDDVPFFSNSHALGSSTIDNLFATTALTASNFASVRASMMEYAGEDGESLMVRPDVLLVPPALEVTARKIVQASTIVDSGTTGAVDNVLRGLCEVIVAPQLSASAGGSDSTWYLLDTTRPIRPFVFQQRQAPEMVMLTNPNDEHVMMRNKFIYGVKARGAGGFGPFWLAAKCSA